MDLLPFLTNLVALSALLPLGLFVFYYATKRVPGKRVRRYSRLWRQTDIGKTLMYQKLAWIVFLLFVAVSLFWEDFPAREYVRGIIYVALVSLFWRVFYVLRRLQKDPGREQDNSKTPLI